MHRKHGPHTASIFERCFNKIFTFFILFLICHSIFFFHFSRKKNPTSVHSVFRFLAACLWARARDCRRPWASDVLHHVYCSPLCSFRLLFPLHRPLRKGVHVAPRAVESTAKVSCVSDHMVQASSTCSQQSKEHMFLPSSVNGAKVCMHAWEMGQKGGKQNRHKNSGRRELPITSNSH